MKGKNDVWAKMLVVMMLFVSPWMVSCSDDDDDNGGNTPPTTITLPASYVIEFPVSALGGDKMMAINPNEAWSVEMAEADKAWFDVSPKSGEKGEQRLTLKIGENAKFDPRTATLTFTVGGEKSTLKVIQEATLRNIRFYNPEVVFSVDTTMVFLERIITNVDTIEVSSKPDWIESVTLKRVIDGAYTAKIVLVPGNYSTEAREGNIVFKDKASDFSVSCPVKARATTDEYVIGACPETVPGFSKEGPYTFTVEVATAPTAGEDTILCYEWVKEWNAFNTRPVNYVREVKPTAQVNAMYGKSVHTLTVDNWLYDEMEDRDGIGAQTRTFGVFAVNKEEVEGFNPNGSSGAPHKLISQTQFDKKNMVSVEAIEGAMSASMIQLAPDQSGDYTIKVKAACYIKLAYGKQGGTAFPGFEPLEGYTVTEVSKTEDGIYTLYEYTLHCPVVETSTPFIFRIYEATPDGSFADESDAWAFFYNLTVVRR